MSAEVVNLTLRQRLEENALLLIALADMEKFSRREGRTIARNDFGFARIGTLHGLERARQVERIKGGWRIADLGEQRADRVRERRLRSLTGTERAILQAMAGALGAAYAPPETGPEASAVLAMAAEGILRPADQMARVPVFEPVRPEMLPEGEPPIVQPIRFREVRPYALDRRGWILMPAIADLEAPARVSPIQ